MEKISHSLTCLSCSKDLPIDHIGPCENCGEDRKRQSVLIEEEIKILASIEWRQVREHYEKNKILFPLVLTLTLAAPFLGLFLVGWWGVGGGLIIGCLTFFLGLRSITKVREIREGQ